MALSMPSFTEFYCRIWEKNKDKVCQNIQDIDHFPAFSNGINTIPSELT